MLVTNLWPGDTLSFWMIRMNRCFFMFYVIIIISCTLYNIIIIMIMWVAKIRWTSLFSDLLDIYHKIISIWAKVCNKLPLKSRFYSNQGGWARIPLSENTKFFLPLLQSRTNYFYKLSCIFADFDARRKPLYKGTLILPGQYWYRLIRSLYIFRTSFNARFTRQWFLDNISDSDNDNTLLSHSVYPPISTHKARAETRVALNVGIKCLVLTKSFIWRNFWNSW